MRIRLLMGAAIVALAAAACGSDDDATVGDPASTGTDAAASGASASAAGDVPDVDMINVHNGEIVNLQSLVDGETPLLLWFWAPH